MFDLLEERALLTTDVWTGAVNSSWGNGGNWSLGYAPAPTDVASFTGGGAGVSLLAATVDGATAISALSINSSWAGTLTFEAGLVLDGTSQVSGGTLDFSQASGGSGASGSLSNSGSLTFGGSAKLKWDAADQITNSGTLIVSNGASFVLAGGGALVNSGTINDQDGGTGFQIGQGSSLLNLTAGTFNFLADSVVGSTGSPGTFTNSGLLEKTAGSGVSSLGVNFNNAGGNIQVATGTLSIAATGGSSSGGVFSASAGATLDLTGGKTVTYTGSYGGTGSGAVAIKGGTLAIGAGGATFNFSGPLLQWSGGTIDTSGGKLTNTGTINLTAPSGGSMHLKGTGVLSNFGTMKQLGAGTFDLDSPATLVNQSAGVYNFAADASISEDQSGGTFSNAGLVEKTGGTGTSSFDVGISFQNTGTVSVQSGTLAIHNSGAIITAGSLASGTWNVAAGGSLSLTGNVTTLGATVDLQGQNAKFGALGQLATISSTGALSLTNGASFSVPANLENAGTIDLGPGTLTIPGNFTQDSTGALNIAVNGTTAGSGFGRITVHSKATLDGSLAATVASGFTPTAGQSLAIIGFGSLSGTFSVVSGLTLGGPLSLSAHYGTSSVALETVKTVAATLSSSQNPAGAGDAITFTVTVEPVAGQTGTPTGTVTFLDGTTSLGTAALSGGHATFSPSAPLSLGLHSISVVYSGDASFGSCSSNTVLQKVQDGTKTAVTPSANPSVFSQQLKLTVTVTSAVSGAGTPSGSVTFMDGTTSLGTATLTAGSAVFTVPKDLSVATHSITAVYGGDSAFATSTSPVLAQVVNQDGSITTLNSSVNPSSFGNSVTLLATVTCDAQGRATPTGSITFMNGSTSLGTVSLTAGKGSLKVSALPAGSDSIKAVYSGDTNFKGSSSPALTQTVNTQGTQTLLQPAAAPSVYGQKVTFNVSVRPNLPGGPAATGTVSILVNPGSSSQKVAGTFPLVNGAATVSPAILAIGNVSVEAKYNGDTNYSSSVSTSVIQTVGQDGSVTSLSGSGSPSAPGAPIILTATVSANAPGSGTPTGSVTFMDGAVALGTSSLSSGKATLTRSFELGNHSITAVYGGDANFKNSTSPGLSETIAQVGSQTTLTSSSISPVFGQAVQFTATVTPTSGLGAPDGAVTFLSGTTALESVPLAGGSAIFSTTSLPLGTSSISAVYDGSSGFTGSNSPAVDENVAGVGTTVRLTSSSNPGSARQFVMLTATVSSVAPGIASPVGTVTFKLGKKTLGTATLSGGTAVLRTKKLALGANKITVVYAGNAEFGASTSAIFKEVIKLKPPKKPKKR